MEGVTGECEKSEKRGVDKVGAGQRKSDTRKANDGVLMSKVMNNCTGRDDKRGRSHEGRGSGPMRR